MTTAQTIDKVRELLNEIEFDLGHLSSYDGARNPEASYGHALDIGKNALGIERAIRPLIARFARQAEKKQGGPPR